MSRLATLDELLETTIPIFLINPPCKATLRVWFKAARIPQFKMQPLAKRGGGPIRYSVRHVEQFFRKHTPGL